MAVNEKITCDVCGIQKGETNHWMLWKTDFAIPGYEGEIGGISFAPWHKDLYRNYNHLCGEACAGRLLARSVEEWREMEEMVRNLTHDQGPLATLLPDGRPARAAVTS